MGNKVSISGELLSDNFSKVGNVWPDSIPLNKTISIETQSNKYKNLISKCAESKWLNIQDIKKRLSQKAPEEIIIEFLNHHSVQFNSKKKFRDSKKIKEIVSNSLSNNSGVSILIPLFCPVANWAKRFNEPSVTFAEKVTLKTMQNICNNIKCVSEIDIKINIVSDATFYTKTLSANPIVTNKYLRELKEYVDYENLSNLTIYDMSELIGNDIDDFCKYYSKWNRYFLLNDTNPPNDIGNINIDTLRKSLVNSITSNDLDATYDEQKNLFFYGKTSSNFAKSIQKRAFLGIADYLSLKFALDDLNWEKRYFRNSIRATIHTKDLPILGMRVYPEYKKNSKYLPYHGIAIIRTHKDSQDCYMQILPEIEAAANNKNVRVVNSNQMSEFYIQENEF